MFCPNCGNKIEKGMSFCPKCGTRVEEVLPAQTMYTTEYTDSIPVEEGWSSGAMVLLVVLTILIPLAGIIIGFVNGKKVGKEKQAKTLKILGFVLIAINIVLIALTK